jgi:uncharacterized Fe-S center protein
MPSKVYFIPVNNSDSSETIANKLKLLLSESKVLDFIRKEDSVAVKVHFGEEGNTGFVRPEFVRVVCDGVKLRAKSLFLADTNTLYRGKRTNSKDHLALAYEHGFTKEATGAEVFIPDDTKKKDTAAVGIYQKFIKSAKLAKVFLDIDPLVVVSHFKGHMLSGFGGALKNLGMGCATREGKMAQHCDISPIIYENACTGCGECAVVCPTEAIRLVNKKSTVEATRCIGCASCIGACPTMAMSVDFKAGDIMQEKMIEYAFAVLKGKENKVGFVNFALRINKECDCWGLENPTIAPDIGIFASADPVSIDKAGLDLVNRACGKNIFKEFHPDQDSMIQLRYAQELGLGNLEYELIDISGA